MVTFSIATVLLVLSLEFAAVVCMNDDPINNGSAQIILTEQVCVVSNNSLNMTEIEGRCFLACVSEKFRDESGMWNYSLSIYWPFVTRTNCATSSNLYQCTVGCVRSQHLSHLENNLRCRNKCLDHCNDLISSLMCDGLTPLCHPWISEECQITCNPYLSNNNNPCRKGCMLEDELPKKQNQSQIPFTPIGPPRLIPVQNTDSAGQSIFIVDLSGTVPELQDCDSANKNDISPVVFLFKFEDVNSHNISFNWTENPFALLNLTGYACQELQVSFAVGNIAGLSEFSQPARIKLNRNETMVSILNSPLNLTVTETVDTRIGFFGHVILNISWDVPQKHSYLDYYMITVTTADGFNVTMCGCKTWSRKVQLNESFLSIEAESVDSLPLVSCSYDIQIYSVGRFGSSNTTRNTYVINTTSICPHDQRVVDIYSVPTIIGVSLSSFLVALIILFLLIGLAVWIIKKLRQQKKVYRTVQGPHDPIFSGGTRNFHLQLSIQTSLQNLDRWEISSKDIITKDLLGEGVFGEVYRGIIKCPIVNPKVWSSGTKKTIYTPVAIKRLKPSAQANERKDFLSEIEIMKKVAEGQNPHVVGLLGCVTIQEPLCLITEFVKYGDLLSYLRVNRRMCIGSNTEEDDNDDAYLELGNVSPVDLVSFAYQITSGMEYLSSLGIVHRDLASRNILVDEGKVLKITDFGLSRETDEIYVQKRTGRVPLKWMAIESIIAREFTSASDVWSFGVVLWEIGTLGGIPFPNIQNDNLLLQLKEGYRMEKPDNCSPEVYDIMLMCWKDQPKERPTFKELRAKFDAMLLAEKKNTYITLSGIDESKSYYQSLPPVITLDLPIRKLASSKVSTVSLDETLSTGRKKERDLTRFRNSLLSLQDQQSQSESRYVQSPMKEVGSSPALSPTL